MYTINELLDCPGILDALTDEAHIEPEIELEKEDSWQ